MGSRFDKPENRAKTRARFEKAVLGKMVFGDDKSWMRLTPRSKIDSFDWALDYFVSFDPTPEKQYVLWMLAQYVRKEGGIRLFEDLYRAGIALETYALLKKTGYFVREKERAAPFTDILKLSFAQLEEFVDSLSDAPITSKAEEDRVQERKLISDGSCSIMLDSKSCKIVIPNNEEAASYFGRNTKWCTSASNGNMFSSYARNGPLYIVLDKKNNRRWQFHFETNQFMDERDYSIRSLKGFPEEAKAFFGIRLLVRFAPEEIKNFEDLSDTDLAFVLNNHPKIIAKLTIDLVGEWKLSATFKRMAAGAAMSINRLWDHADEEIRKVLLRELLKRENFWEIAPSAAKTQKVFSEWLERLRVERYGKTGGRAILEDHFFRCVPVNLLSNASVEMLLDISPNVFLSLPNQFKKDKLIQRVLMNEPRFVKHVSEPSIEVQRFIINNFPQYITALNEVHRSLTTIARTALLRHDRTIDLSRYPTLRESETQKRRRAA